MKASIYARVSTDDKDQNPERQKSPCEKYAEIHEHEIAGYYQDYISGETNPFEREGFKKLLESRPKAIIVHEISRFSREHPTKVMRRLTELRDRGIKIISVTEPAFNMEGEMSDLIQYMLTWYNNYFLKQLKRNIKTGMDRARKNGKQIGRSSKKFNERRAYHLLFVEKKSQRKVAQDLGVSLATVNRFKKVHEKNPPSFINEQGCSKTYGSETPENLEKSSSKN